MKITAALPALAAAAGLALMATACSSDSDSAKTTTAVTAAPVDTAAATSAPAADTTAAGTATSEAPATEASAAGPAAGGGDAEGGLAVDIAGFKFGPPELDVAVGDTVTWTNSDAQAHTATSSGVFDTGSIAPGATATATFDTAGTYQYICSFHPFMKGTIVVS